MLATAESTGLKNVRIGVGKDTSCVHAFEQHISQWWQVTVYSQKNTMQYEVKTFLQSQVESQGTVLCQSSLVRFQ